MELRGPSCFMDCGEGQVVDVNVVLTQVVPERVFRSLVQARRPSPLAFWFTPPCLKKLPASCP